MEESNSTPNQDQTITPPTEVVPEVSQTPVSQVPNQVEEEEKQAFYMNWKFWLILLLVINLGIALYIWALPILLPRVVVDNQIFAEKIYIDKVVAPSNGFLVLQLNSDGIPGFIIAKSEFLIPDTYTNFNLSLAGEEDLPLEVVEKIKPGDIVYATFYKDVDGDGLFRPEIDSEIATNFLKSKYQTKFIFKSTP